MQVASPSPPTPPRPPASSLLVRVQPAWPPPRKVETGQKSPGVPAAHGTHVMG